MSTVRFIGGGPLDGDTRDVPAVAGGYIVADLSARDGQPSQHRYRRIAPDVMEYVEPGVWVTARPSWETRKGHPRRIYCQACGERTEFAVGPLDSRMVCARCFNLADELKLAAEMRMRKRYHLPPPA